MFVEEVFANLIASATGALMLFLAGKMFNNWFYVGFLVPEKEKRRFIKLFRRFPWRHAYKYAEATAEVLRGEGKTKKAEELYEPTIIIGIGRGGAIYGSIFSYYMKETPLLALDRKYLFDNNGERIGEDWYYPIDIPKELLSKVLLIAGEYHSGKTMQIFKDRLTEIGAAEIRTCVLYYQTGLPKQIGLPDYYGISGKRDCLMPWQEKQFLRTWKESNDAKVRDYSLKNIQMESFKDGFFLMRHAKTDANIQDVFIGGGSPNESINADGRIEAQKVGGFLKETLGKLDLIYCSPMKRCLETAQEIVKDTGGDVITDDRLTEVDFGNWEGVRRAAIPPEEYDAYMQDQHYHIPGSNDSYAANQKRAAEFLDEMINRHATTGKRVLVITHKSIGRIMVQSIEHKERFHFRSIPMENASLRKVVVKNGEATIPYYIKVMDGDVVV